MFGALMMEVTTALNALPGTLVITYDNQSGTSHSTASLTLTASATVNTAALPSLASGDYGIRNITGAVRSGGTAPTGVINFYGLLPIGVVQIGVVNVTGSRDLITAAPFPPRLLANEQIALLTSIATARAWTGFIRYIGDS
jgi:hypothetical protein